MLLTMNLKILFIVLVSVVFVAGVIILILLILKKRQKSDKYKMVYYKKIYHIAIEQDYYLINDFLFKIDESQVARIDHILFGEKFIYLINDYSYPGDITGKEDDKSLILQDLKGKKFYTDNPFISMKKILRCLSSITGIDPSMFIGVNLVNNDCHTYIQSTSKQFYIVKIGKLTQLVKNIESTPIGKIKEEELEATVKAIDKLNRRNKNK